MIINESNYNRTLQKKRNEDDEDDFTLDIKFENMTVMNDMDLVIKKFKDRRLNINITRSNDQMCYLRVNLTMLKNYTSESAMKKVIMDNFKVGENMRKENIEIKKNNTNMNNLTKIENKVKLNNQMRMIQITNNSQENNFNNNSLNVSLKYKMFNETLNSTYSNNNTRNNRTIKNFNANETLKNKTFTNSINPLSNNTQVNTSVTYNINSPSNESDSEIIISYLFSMKNIKEKDNICSKCLDSVLFLDAIYDEVKYIKKDLKEFTNKTNSKQETIIKFSDYINRINLVKIELYQMTTVIDILKGSECSNYENNNQKYQSTSKKSSQLIEAIQDVIRKQNLNVNFIVLT